MSRECEQCKQPATKLTLYHEKGWLCEKCKADHIKEPVAPLIKFKGAGWPSKDIKLKHKYFGH